MLLFHILLSQKPVRVRTLEAFLGRNPWTLSSQEEWSLELFRKVIQPEIVPEGKISVLTPSVPIPMKMGELLALRSNSDGNVYFLPDSLLGYYQKGSIPIHALPDILHHLGKVKKSDSVSPFQNKVIVGSAIFFILMFFFILWGIFHDMQLERVWRAILLMGGIMSPVLIAGAIFLFMGVSRLNRHSKQVEIIRQFLQDQRLLLHPSV